MPSMDGRRVQAAVAAAADVDCGTSTDGHLEVLPWSLPLTSTFGASGIGCIGNGSAWGGIGASPGVIIVGRLPMKASAKPCHISGESNGDIASTFSGRASAGTDVSRTGGVL